MDRVEDDEELREDERKVTRRKSKVLRKKRKVTGKIREVTGKKRMVRRREDTWYKILARLERGFRLLGRTAIVNKANLLLVSLGLVEDMDRKRRRKEIEEIPLKEALVLELQLHLPPPSLQVPAPPLQAL